MRRLRFLMEISSSTHSHRLALQRVVSLKRPTVRCLNLWEYPLW